MGGKHPVDCGDMTDNSVIGSSDSPSELDLAIYTIVQLVYMYQCILYAYNLYICVKQSATNDNSCYG